MADIKSALEDVKKCVKSGNPVGKCISLYEKDKHVTFTPKQKSDIRKALAKKE
jgi:hypothetical protein